MSRRGIAWIAAGVAGLIAAGGVGAASAATGASQAAAPGWRVVKSVKDNANGDFSAVVATGKTTAWAFNGFSLSAGETAWQRTGSTWKQGTFPGRSGEYVALAAATSPSDVWAFANNVSLTSARALRLIGSKWVAVKTFGGNIVGATVLSSKDVWVFGEVQSFVPAIGVWHYNGSTWKQVVKNFGGGSALSDHDVWAFTKTSVEHYNGNKWTATSVRNLLPAVQRGGLNDPQLVGILALSDSDVFAIGNGEAQDEGGPVVVLQYNGHKWVKRATGEFGYGPLDGFSYDGAGGLWLPMDGPVGGTSYLVHYAAGKLTKAVLPVNAATITVRSVARVPGTTQQLAGGFTHPSGNRTAIDAVILGYS
jgi:hypothetical protein